jgi:hypothetical protein
MRTNMSSGKLEALVCIAIVDIGCANTKYLHSFLLVRKE